MKVEDIKINYHIEPNEPGIGPEIGYINARFPLNEKYKISDLEEIYEKSWKFTTEMNKKLKFKVSPSVDPAPILDHEILELPTSNHLEIEFMTIIPLSKDYIQEINTVEQTLKDLIVKNYSNFY